mmetsp:Transcript_63428/g.112752  ORF Transcript_63428/g.112752 Transcript_63428/m.112752 type:complete len:275 (-) Transcript_63428:522-1346(-)
MRSQKSWKPTLPMSYGSSTWYQAFRTVPKTNVSCFIMSSFDCMPLSARSCSSLLNLMSMTWTWETSRMKPELRVGVASCSAPHRLPEGVPALDSDSPLLLRTEDMGPNSDVEFSTSRSGAGDFFDFAACALRLGVAGADEMLQGSLRGSSILPLGERVTDIDFPVAPRLAGLRRPGVLLLRAKRGVKGAFGIGGEKAFRPPPKLMLSAHGSALSRAAAVCGSKSSIRKSLRPHSVLRSLKILLASPVKPISAHLDLKSFSSTPLTPCALSGLMP